MDYLEIKDKLDNTALSVTPTEERGIIAFDLEKNLINQKRGISVGFIEIGKILKEIRDNSYFVELGYNRFSDWLNSPDVSITPGWAWNFIAMYTLFVEQHQVDMSRLCKIDYNKLSAIIPVVKDHPEQLDTWLVAAESLRKSDLVREIKSQKVESTEAEIVEKIESAEIKVTSRIINEDGAIGMQSLASDSINLVITTPPTIQDERSKTYLDEFDFSKSWITEAVRVLKPNGSMFIRCTDKNLFAIGHVLRTSNLQIVQTIVRTGLRPNKAVSLNRFITTHEIIIWARKGFNHVCNLVDFEESILKIAKHPAQQDSEMPFELTEKIVAVASNSGDTVLDPFCGAGEVGEGTKALNRSFIGFQKHRVQ